MELIVPIGAALVLGFIAWKLLKGLIKIAVICAILALAAYLYWQGVIG